MRSFMFFLVKTKQRACNDKATNIPKYTGIRYNYEKIYDKTQRMMLTHTNQC